MEFDEVDTIRPLEKDREALSDIYPRQKTYDEKLEERRKIAEVKLSRRPKFTLVTAGLVFSGAVALLLNSARVVAWIDSIEAGLMGLVFFSFFVGLTVFGLVLWQIKRVNSYFYDRSLSSVSFLFVYVFLAFGVAWLYRTLSPGEGSVALSVILCAALWVTMVVYGAVYVKLATD